MRRIILLFSISLVLIATALVVSDASTPYVEVLDADGRVLYLTSGETVWKDLGIGAILYSGDRIRTYYGAEAEIAFEGNRNNVVSIRSGSHVILRFDDKEKIELIDGEVFLLVEELPRGSMFEIRTPSAIVGVRGTGSAISADKGKTVMNAHENDSYAKGIRRDGTQMSERTVPQGYKVSVKLYEEPSKLMKISKRDNDKWKSWRKEREERKKPGKSAQSTMEKIEDKQKKIEDRQDTEKMDKLEEFRDKKWGMGQQGT